MIQTDLFCKRKRSGVTLFYAFNVPEKGTKQRALEWFKKINRAAPAPG
jgi:hypothetical protein